MTTAGYQSSTNVVRNFAFGLTTWILPILVGVVATPIIIRSIGVEHYGIYALVLGFVAYSFSFNIGRALTKYIAEYRISGEFERINRLISATLFISVVFGILGIILICGLAHWYVYDISRLSGDSAETAMRALFIASAIVFFTLISVVYDSILQGLHRYDVYSKLFNLNSIVLAAGNVFLALAGFGVIALLVWNIIVTIATTVMYFFAVRRLLPNFEFAVGFDRNDVRKIVFFSGWLVGYQIFGNFLLLFERAWVTRKFGLDAVSFYVVPMTLGIYVQNLVVSLLLALFPLASELQNDRERLLKLYKKSTKLTCAIVVFAALTLIVESSTLLSLWIDPNFAAESSMLLVLHTLTFGMLAIGTVSWRMMEGIGRASYNFFVVSSMCVLTLVLFVVLTPRFGLEGVGAARTAAFSLTLISILYIEKLIFEKFLLAFWVGVTARLAAAGAAAIAVQMVSGFLFGPTWPGFILGVGISAIAYLGTLVAVKFADKEDTELIKGSFAKHVRK